MAIVTLQEVKDYLKVYHSADDDELEQLRQAAEDEAIQFLGYDTVADWEDFLDSSENPYDANPYSVQVGVLILVQASYEGSADEMSKYRNIAETKLMPYRVGLGI